MTVVSGTGKHGFRQLLRVCPRARETSVSDISYSLKVVADQGSWAEIHTPAELRLAIPMLHARREMEDKTKPPHRDTCLRFAVEDVESAKR